MGISKKPVVASKLGLILWILCAQYYAIQAIAALAWKTSYSISQNTISDLGNTVCGTYGGGFVCSPLHGVMNTSFMILGIFMISGAVLIYRSVYKEFAMSAALALITVAGLGTLLVGLFPENSIRVLHITGAAMSFVPGNLGLVLFGLTSAISKSLRVFARISGCIALVALALFITRCDLGIGNGGMERLVAYPQTIWLIVFGVSTLVRSVKSKY